MTMKRIFAGDYGTDIVLTVTEDGLPVNISTATVTKFHFADPDGVVTLKTAAFDSDGVDGKLRYKTVEGDITKPGTWYVQAYVSMPTWTGYSTWMRFVVLDPAG